MPSPVLYIFSISHFCEKARWALDYLGVPYKLLVLAPGPHMALAKKLGLQRGSLPILQVGEEVIQGSSAIIDWAEQHKTNQRSLARLDDAASEMEQRLDDQLGVHVRRMFYSEALVEQSHTVKQVFQTGLSWSQRLMLNLSWPVVRKKMIKLMDLGKVQGDQSLAIVAAELEWLDGLLADGRPFIMGDELSRLDITAASLLARIVMPPQYPTDDGFSHPPRLAEVAVSWRQRPALQWVLKMYAEHRAA